MPILRSRALSLEEVMGLHNSLLLTKLTLEKLNKNVYIRSILDGNEVYTILNIPP